MEKNKSYVLQILEQFGDERGQEILNEMNQDPLENAKKQVRNMFSYLDENELEEILKKYNNSPEDAFEELEERNSHIEEQKRREREERKREREKREERRRKEKNDNYIQQFVKNFKIFTEKEIEEVFKSNDNDPQKTGEALYDMIKKREKQDEEAKKMKRELDIQNLLTSKKKKKNIQPL